jgi:hypothetical protein
MLTWHDTAVQREQVSGVISRRVGDHDSLKIGLWEGLQLLSAITLARRQSIALQMTNTGRMIFRGSWPIPTFPAPGEAPPPIEALADSAILNDLRARTS